MQQPSSSSGLVELGGTPSALQAPARPLWVHKVTEDTNSREQRGTPSPPTVSIMV